MTRAAYTEKVIRESKMERHQFLETFRIYPCWCGHSTCLGWRHWTDREIQVVLASMPHCQWILQGDLDGFTDQDG